MGLSCLTTSFSSSLPISSPTKTTCRRPLTQTLSHALSFSFHSLHHSDSDSIPKSLSSSFRPNRNPRISLTTNHSLLDNGWSPSTRRDFRARTSSSDSPQPPPPPTSSAATGQSILFGSALTVAFAVANRVLYKLALVPMKEYPFFLAQLTTFGYVVVYFLILCTRYNAGIVTDEMIDEPKSLFVAIGVLEALGVALGMASAAMLPGPAIPILNQTFLVWQLMFSVLILGRTYTARQIGGCLLVAAGVALAVTGGSSANQMLSGIEIVWPGLMIASCAFQAGASIIKEFVFIDAAARLKGKSLDIFVVNSFGSGFQALFVLLFLPLLSNIKGIPFAQLPSYLKGGVGCFLNVGNNASGCDGSPLLPLLYIATNLMFNISVLNLVKTSSAVVSSLAVMLAVPISIFILSVPLPYLPEGSTLSPFFLLGSLILVLGLVLYTLPQSSKQH